MANCSTNEPSARELFAVIGDNSAAIALIIVESVFAVATILMFFEACFYIHGKITDSRTRVRLTIIIGLYPVYSTFSLLALYIPRAHLITHLSSTLYFSLALFQFLMLIVGYYGGREQLLVKLKHEKMPIASPPILCCVPCIPGADMTPRNLIRLKRIVLQAAFIRPTCNFIALILWADGTYIAGWLALDSAYVWLTVIALASSVFALYGVIMLMRISDKALPNHHVKPKFFLVQLVLVLVTGQLLILGILAIVGVIPCDYPMNSLTRSYYISDLLVIIEMLILLAFARFYFRKRMSNIPGEREEGSLQKDLGALSSTSSDPETLGVNPYTHLPSVTSIGSDDVIKMEAKYGMEKSNGKPYMNNNGCYLNHGADVPNGKATMLVSVTKEEPDDVEEVESNSKEELKTDEDHRGVEDDEVFVGGSVTHVDENCLDEKL